MNQDSVDDLLKQVETQTATAATQAGLDPRPTPEDIPGDMAAPGGSADMHSPAADGGPAGEFAPPPAVAPARQSGLGKEFSRLLAIEVPLIVQLGQRRMTVSEVMRLAVGAIIEFNKSAEDEMDLLANNKAIGRGHAVKVGENFGIKISQMGSIKDTIRKLGGQD